MSIQTIIFILVVCAISYYAGARPAVREKNGLRYLLDLYLALLLKEDPEMAERVQESVTQHLKLATGKKDAE